MKIFAILFALLGMMTVMATATTTMSPSYSLAVDSAMQAPAESAECTLIMQTLHHLACELTILSHARRQRQRRSQPKAMPIVLALHRPLPKGE